MVLNTPNPTPPVVPQLQQREGVQQEQHALFGRPPTATSINVDTRPQEQQNDVMDVDVTPATMDIPNASSTNAHTVPEDEDAKQERKCTLEARYLLERCVRRCPQLNRYRLKLLLGYGTFGIVVEGLELVPTHDSPKVCCIRWACHFLRG